MTAVATAMAGKLVAYTPKKVGRTVRAGKSCGTLESGKWVGPAKSMAGGEVAALVHVGCAERAAGQPGMTGVFVDERAALIAEAIAHYLDELQEMIGELIRSDLPVEERLKSIIDLALASRDVLEWRFRFQVEAWSFIKDDPELLETVRVASLGQITRTLFDVGGEYRRAM